ncbi:hypothetical protein AALP_AA7G187200 [Arabis alpina]|uniref:Uncharacterized protein n=1 Tax=Arabis alpina TaxID=50452 RepID=A0A087GJ00_ARAAL|nr:hypothetical protein AALP_AA7G187200 [Arabis alpina]
MIELIKSRSRHLEILYDITKLPIDMNVIAFEFVQKARTI